MVEENTYKALRLNVRLAACLMWLIYNVINPAILWCFGWKYESEICMGKKFECWVDPIDGKRYAQSKAIEKCEARIEGG